MKKVSENEVSELDKQLFRTLRDCKIDFDTITGVFLLLTGKRERKKLLSYAEFRGNRNNESDLLSYAMFLRQQKGEREQVMPFGLFARYIGETNSELTKDKIYRIDVIYGVCEDVYLLVNDNNKQKEYPASSFLLQKYKTVVYDGSKKKGFHKGQQYKVEKFHHSARIHLENDLVCEIYEVEPVEFEDDNREKELKEIKYDEILNDVRRFFEFNDIKEIYDRLDDKTQYIYGPKDNWITGRDKIIEHFTQEVQNRLKKGINIICEEVVVTDDDEFLNVQKGLKFLALFSSDNEYTDSIFVEYDKYHITKLIHNQDCPACEFVEKYE